MTINFHGLSETQVNLLNQQYANFIPECTVLPTIHCHAYRLAHAPDVHPESLTQHEQYAPRIVRSQSGDSLHLTGINFEATYALTPDSNSELGVVKEQELAHENVIENYLRILSAHTVLPQQGVVLHSAGLVFDNNAYIFSGRSNAGKTTLTRKAYTAGARILSDDINLVLPSESGYRAYAVPFTGEFGRTLNHAGGKESYPVAGIILLEQSQQLHASQVSKATAVARLLSGCPFVNTDEHESDALFNSVTSLVNKIPVIRLQNRRNDTITNIMATVKRQFALIKESPSESIPHAK